MERMSKQQLEHNKRMNNVFDFVIEYMTESAGRPPSNREIGQEFNLSTSVVRDLLKDLALRGDIELLGDGEARGIKIPDYMFMSQSLFMAMLGNIIERYEDFDFDAWRESWGHGKQHPAEALIQQALELVRDEVSE